MIRRTKSDQAPALFHDDCVEMVQSVDIMAGAMRSPCSDCKEPTPSAEAAAGARKSTVCLPSYCFLTISKPERM